MPVFNNALAGGSFAAAGGYQIERSLRFNASDSSYLSRTPSSAGNQKTFTFSTWLKLSDIGTGKQTIFSAGNNSALGQCLLEYDGSYQQLWFRSSVAGGTMSAAAYTTGLFRDPSAWYHLVMSVDTTQGTAADRVKLYINGVSQAFVTYSIPLNGVCAINSASLHKIGRSVSTSSDYLNSYLADVHFIDGQALAPTDFGELDDNNVWQPKEFAGTYGWFDQSQTWSSLWSTTGTIYGSAAALHDATISTASYFQIDNSGTFTLPTALPVTSLRFYTQVYGSGGTVSVNGTNVTSQLQSTGIAWSEITGFTSLSTIAVTGNNDGNNLIGWYAIELNGKLLFDSGISGIADNSFHLPFTDNSSNAALGYDANGTTRYRFDVTGTAIASTVSNLFDGSTSTAVDGTAATVMTFTPSTPIAYSSSVEVYTASSQTTRTYSLNGGTGVTNAANNWTSLASGSGTITSISQTPNSGYSHSWSAIRVDGTILTDPNDWTVNNLTAAAPTASYSSAQGSNITTTEAAKVFDTDDSDYGVATGDLIGFAYSGNSVEMKIQNTDTTQTTLSFYIQPYVSGGATNSGSWSNPSVGTVSSNVWSIPANSTGTATFTFPSGYDGVGRLYLSGWSSAFRMYSMKAGAADGSGIDSLVDSPTNGTQIDSGAGGEVVGNCCIWNPLGITTSTLTNGNLEVSLNGSSNLVYGSIGVTSGKWYWEVTPTSGSIGMIGIVDLKVAESLMKYDQTGGIYIYQYQGSLYGGLGRSSVNATSYGTAIAANDVVGVALDMDNGQIQFYKNGSGFGQTSLSLSGKRIAPGFNNGGGAVAATANFGQRPFSYTAPSGYKALNTANLPTPTIADGSLYFDTKLFNANNGTQTISGYNFSPDLVWTKSRANSYAHQLWDQVRGANKALMPNETSVEANLNNSLAFTSDGFTSSTNNNANYSSGGSVAWAWDGGTSTVTNNDGSIASQVRANPSAGFSIVSYSGNSTSGATVGHSLNSKPELIIIKATNTAQGWATYHGSVGANKYLQLNANGAAATYSGFMNSTEPTTSVFSLGNDNFVNTGSNYIAYCFAPVAGYSAMGSYSGNGAADGTFIYTGFRPAFILIKASSIAGEDWVILDTSRASSNVSDLLIKANTNEQEFTNSAYNTDILSNGFKIRNNNPRFNQSGGTYIYYSVAENPFKSSRAR